MMTAILQSLKTEMIRQPQQENSSKPLTNASIEQVVAAVVAKYVNSAGQLKTEKISFVLDNMVCIKKVHGRYS